MDTLRSRVIRLAKAKPALRPVLLPLVQKRASGTGLRVYIDEWDSTVYLDPFRGTLTLDFPLIDGPCVGKLKEGRSALRCPTPGWKVLADVTLQLLGAEKSRLAVTLYLKGPEEEVESQATFTLTFDYLDHYGPLDR